MKPLFLLIVFLVIRLNILAQFPSYFNYTIENGAPSNEIYCILEDKEGYIWIGCDAGVYFVRTSEGKTVKFIKE